MTSSQPNDVPNIFDPQTPAPLPEAPADPPAPIRRSRLAAPAHSVLASHSKHTPAFRTAALASVPPAPPLAEEPIAQNPPAPDVPSQIQSQPDSFTTNTPEIIAMPADPNPTPVSQPDPYEPADPSAPQDQFPPTDQYAASAEGVDAPTYPDPTPAPVFAPTPDEMAEPVPTYAQAAPPVAQNPPPTYDVTPAAPPVIIHAPPPHELRGEGAAQRGGLYGFLAVLWIALWAGAISLVLNHQFDRKMDWNTSYFSIAARNIVRDGFMPLKGGVYITAGEGFGMEREFYPAHPPMTTWLLAGWMKAFGTSDQMIRALPLAFTAFNLLLLFLLVRRVFGSGTGLAVMIIASLMPMTAFYAQNVNMEPFVMTFMLIAANAYLSVARTRSKFASVILILAVILGCLTDWPMYIFTGLLAVGHFLHRRSPLESTLPPADPETPLPRRPIVFSVVLLLLPAAVFGVYVVYLGQHGSSFSDLRDSANSRMMGDIEQLTPPATKPTTLPAGATALPAATQPAAKVADKPASPGLINSYKTLAKRFKTFREGNKHFYELFTLPGLFLAGLGLLFWEPWSHRLATYGQPGRRAAFRILLCILLTQVIYTGAFPLGAWEHDFWHYYLIVPVAVFAGGLCVWLTLVQRSGRGFFAGFVDRAAWSIVALIALSAAWILPYQYHIHSPIRKFEENNAGLRLHLAKPLQQLTPANSVIFTDMNEQELQFALPWYADRAMIADGMNNYDTTTDEGLKKLILKHEKRRIYYWWTGSSDDAAALKTYLQSQYTVRHPLGENGKDGILFQVRPRPENIRPTPTPTPPVTPPATTPSTGPATTPTTRP